MLNLEACDVCMFTFALIASELVIFAVFCELKSLDTFLVDEVGRVVLLTVVCLGVFVVTVWYHSLVFMCSILLSLDL
jgi:hypothetical protein